MVAGDLFHFYLVYRPERLGAHDFQLPLSLEGVPPGGAERLRVPVTAAGLEPTLTFLSTEVDFGRTLVSRDPCALKQYQGEFVLRNASDKVRPSGEGLRGRHGGVPYKETTQYASNVSSGAVLLSCAMKGMLSTTAS